MSPPSERPIPVYGANAITFVEPPAWITDNALILSPMGDVDTRFVGYALTNLSLEKTASTTAQPLITQTQVKQSNIPYFALPTQQRIADFLDRETERIDALIDKKRRLIDLLEEKRTATITQAVT
jgi:type I restriction enzyme S subunit